MGFRYKVLKFIKCIPVGGSISDKMLTLKLTILTALTAAYRVSKITNSDINFLGKHPACYSFTFSKISKSWKKRQSAPVIKLLVYDLADNDDDMI